MKKTNPRPPVQRPGPGTSVTVVGLARSGAAAAEWLIRLGCLVRVTEASISPALEQAAQQLRASGVLVELGGHHREMIEEAHLVVTSPGVPLSAKPVRWAWKLGIPVVGELELGSWYCSGRIAAVTGSNGKSSVVTLLGEVFKKAGMDAVVCGNIGSPLTGQLGRIRPSTVVVLEVSSFQLETSLSFRPEIGCILNVTDNHFDRHGSFEEYKAAKGRIFEFQRPEDWALLNADDRGSSSFKKGARGRLAFYSREEDVMGACVEGSSLCLTLPGISGEICRRDEMALQGPHHEQNALAVSCLAGMFGVRPEVSGEVIRSFKGLPHRQQAVDVFRGITFVNDSKSTTVAAGLSAIQAARGRVILIAGGIDKGSDFRALRGLKNKLKAAVLIGRDGPKIAAALKGTVTCLMAASLAEAVRTAFGMAKEGEWVLLSPMCTSFDMFRDFEDRGEQFEWIVRDLAGSAESLAPAEGRL